MIPTHLPHPTSPCQILTKWYKLLDLAAFNLRDVTLRRSLPEQAFPDKFWGHWPKSSTLWRHSPLHTKYFPCPKPMGAALPATNARVLRLLGIWEGIHQVFSVEPTGLKCSVSTIIKGKARKSHGCWRTTNYYKRLHSWKDPRPQLPTGSESQGCMSE